MLFMIFLKHYAKQKNSTFSKKSISDAHTKPILTELTTTTAGLMRNQHGCYWMFETLK